RILDLMEAQEQAREACGDAYRRQDLAHLRYEDHLADDPPDNDGDDLGGDSGYRAYAALLAARHARLAAEVAARAAVPKLYQGWLFDVLMSLRELAEATTAGGSEVEKWAQARLLREIAGNPFRLVRVRPQWLWWEDGLARRLAEAMYEERS